MTVYLYITEGPLKGFKIRTKNGLTLGGSRSHVNLKDQYASDLHARILIDDNNNFYIKDEGSETGTYYDGKRINRSRLMNGSEIKIGRTLFQVNYQKDSVDMPVNTDFWTELIKNKYQNVSQKLDDKPIKLQSMIPIVKLQFIKGLQLETEWHLGYGPRVIGSESTDLKIMEKNAPAICFELIPTDKGILFQTDHKKIVQINGESRKQHTLKQDDLITIYDSQIKVSLIQ